MERGESLPAQALSSRTYKLLWHPNSSIWNSEKAQPRSCRRLAVEEGRGLAPRPSARPLLVRDRRHSSGRFGETSPRMTKRGIANRVGPSGGSSTARERGRRLWNKFARGKRITKLTRRPVQEPRAVTRLPFFFTRLFCHPAHPSAQPFPHLPRKAFIMTTPGKAIG